MGTCKEYLVALKTWYTLGWSGILAAVAFASIKWDVPDWVWWGAIVIGFVTAQIIAWLDMRNQRDAAIDAMRPKNRLHHTKTHYRDGILEIELTNKQPTLNEVRINMLVPQMPGLQVKRIPNPNTQEMIVGVNDVIKDSDVRPDGGDVLRWMEGDLRLPGGNTAYSWYFRIGTTTEPFTAKLAVGADALGDWVILKMPLP